MILNPLGVPSRMNMGQLFETHLGFAANEQAFMLRVLYSKASQKKKSGKMMKEQGLPEDGKFYLFDGYTGERFDNRLW